jgi:P-type Ca2+ transporter type 2C
VVQVVHAAVPGRARYKVEGLYHSQSLKRLLEARLAEHRGISSVSAEPLTGKVLVFFDSGNLPTAIALLIEQVVAEHQGRTFGPEETSSAQAPRPSPAKDPYHNGVGVTRRPVPQEHQPPTRSLLHDFRASREEPQQAPWHLMTEGAVLTALHSSKASGLSNAAARHNLETYGPNLLPEAEPRSGLSMLVEQFNSLPVGLLAAAAGVSLFTGGVVDALVIMGVVVINATVGYATESQSEKTIHSLKRLVHPSALVIREGSPKEVRAEEVAVGDLVVLKPGSYIAADGRLIEAQRLSVDESVLTGESVPVSKVTAPLVRSDLPLGDRVNMVYMGTLVTGGQGLAVVVATGRFTEIGKIQTLAGEAEAPETPMERQLSQMGTQLVYISGGVCTLVFGLGLLRGYGFIEMLKSAISLAVAAVPEGLPTVATTTLALGIINMRKHHVLIRRLDAVETLGCVQTVCLDKTGTLTLNRMAAVSAYTGMRRLRVTDGRFFLGEDGLDPLACEELVKMAQVCVLCSETEIERQDEHYVVRGSPTENALVYLAINAGVDILRLREECPALHITHRAENRNFMSTIHRVNKDYTDAHGSPFFLTIKGSPAEVLAMCDWQVHNGERVALTEQDRLLIETENERMAGEALRVLGCAYNYLTAADEEVPNPQGLTWLGLVGMTDPIRQGVKEVIGDFHGAGINTIMITGDQSPTAYAIGKELALSPNGHLEILDSTHLTNLDPVVMKALAEKIHVFARVSPAHKLQIVQALQRAGKVVAMTGDGINDGPALKAADIGIAMGNTGTDVAREVADVVLEDDNLETMIVAISQGRTIYTNIRKSVHFLLSTNLSEIMVMFTAIAAGLGQPLNAMQLLWINLISDIFPGLALALEPPEPDVLSQPPRNPEEPIIKTSDFKRIAFESATLSAGALGAYGYGLLRYGIGPQASTLAFTSLTTGQLLHAITSRSETHSVLDQGRGATSLPANPYLKTALLGSFAVQALTLVMPGFRSLLGLTPISWLDGLMIGGSTLLPFVINETTKSRAIPHRDHQEAENLPLAHPLGSSPRPA